MHTTATFLLASVAALYAFAGVSACEGECITGIVDVFAGNYSGVVNQALSDVASEISTQLIPPSSRPSSPVTLLAPIADAYKSAVSSSLTSTMFTTHFHGKCERPLLSNSGGLLLTEGPLLPNGKPAGEAASYPAQTYHNITRFSNGTAQMDDPQGCPDPDCPVVCGTPGSIVHFYGDLVNLAFDGVAGVLRNVTAQGAAYQKVQSEVAKLAKGAKGKGVEASVKSLLGQVPGKVQAGCGGESLARCNWEQAMKAYVLQFN